MAVYDDRLVHAASEGNRRINWLVHWFSSGIMGEWAYQLVSTSVFIGNGCINWLLHLVFMGNGCINWLVHLVLWGMGVSTG